MKILKNPICVVCSLMLIILHAAFALPTSSPHTSSEEVSTQEVSTEQMSLAFTPSPSQETSNERDLFQPHGRSIHFPRTYGDIIVVQPVQDYRKPMVGFEPLGYDDTVDVISGPYDPALSDFKNGPAIVYSVERDMATAESNIVFRPLFTYKKQTAQKRRVYTQPATYSSPPLPVERRRYKAPVNYGGYPSYYYNAQYDYVP